MGAGRVNPRRCGRAEIVGVLVTAALIVAGCSSTAAPATTATTLPAHIVGQARCGDPTGDTEVHTSVQGADSTTTGSAAFDLRAVALAADGTTLVAAWSFAGPVTNLVAAMLHQADTTGMTAMLQVLLHVNQEDWYTVAVVLGPGTTVAATVQFSSGPPPRFGPEQPVEVTSITPTQLQVAVPLSAMATLPARFTWTASAAWIGTQGTSALSELDDCGIAATQHFPDGTSTPAAPTTTLPPTATVTTPAGDTTTTNGDAEPLPPSTADDGTAAVTTAPTGVTLGPPNAGPLPVWASNPPVSGDPHVAAVLTADPALQACPAILPVGDGPSGRLEGWVSAGAGHAHGRWVLTDIDVTVTVDAYSTLPVELQPPYHGDPAMISIEVYGDGSSVVQPDTRGQFVAIITPAGSPCHWVLTLPDDGPGEVGQFMFGMLHALRIIH